MMARVALLLLIITHGSIHLFGFIKAYNLAAISRLTDPISKTNGILWLISAILFLTCATFLVFQKDSWWIPASAALLVSQSLILGNWQDTKFGTIPNILILLITVVGWATWNYSKDYKNKVRTCLEKTASSPVSLLTEKDIEALPDLIKKYIRYSGALNKPKVKNFKVEFEGRIRKDEKSQWMPFTSEQYNFQEASTRLFFMNAVMKNLPVAGFHCFRNGSAFMDIRLLSLFTVQYQSGNEMGIAETVTFFNDMCVMAPATLIDKRIQWEGKSNNCIKATFINNGTRISAELYFNPKGELINFISDDRYAVTENNTMQQLRWSTPMKDYKEMNGYKIAGSADAVYTYPEGEFRYGEFRLTHVEYNVNELK